MSRYGQGFEELEEAPQIKARLKWFNATKGFGFVSPMDGSSDAFLHVSVLHRAGLQALGEQAELLCEVGSGPKGPQVTRIVEVLATGEIKAPDREASGPGYGRQPALTDEYRPSDGFGGGRDGLGGGTADASEQASGVVKWFKADKGFGFITVDGSGQDVFVHKSVLQRSGLQGLEAGQHVDLRVREVEKGWEATWVGLG